jgi:general secretion pathway protein I
VSNARPESTPADAGISIVETLVALFVFALAAVALIAMQAQSVETYSRVETRALGAIVIENALIDVMAARTSPPLGVREGETELAGRGWRWRMDVLSTGDPASIRIEAAAFLGDEAAPAAEISAYRLTSGVAP